VNKLDEFQWQPMLTNNYRGLRPNHGNYSVILDGGYQRSASGNGSSVSNSPRWDIYNLAYGSHIVEITNQLSEPDLGSHPDIDFLQIERTIGHDK
jgi:hypothetical protein